MGLRMSLPINERRGLAKMKDPDVLGSFQESGLIELMLQLAIRHSKMKPQLAYQVLVQVVLLLVHRTRRVIITETPWVELQAGLMVRTMG